MKTVIAQQGEVRIVKIDAVPNDITTKPAERSAAGSIISHSESGHHHLLTGGTEVLERTDDGVPAGMRILYAILDEPQKLIQDAASAHEAVDLEPGTYAFICSREYDPFSDQARRVAD